MNGWISIWLTRRRSSSPANDHWLLTSAPTTQWPGIQTATAAGPALHLPVPRAFAVAVGSVTVGPKPTIRSPPASSARAWPAASATARRPAAVARRGLPVGERAGGVSGGMRAGASCSRSSPARCPGTRAGCTAIPWASAPPPSGRPCARPRRTGPSRGSLPGSPSRGSPARTAAPASSRRPPAGRPGRRGAPARADRCAPSAPRASSHGLPSRSRSRGHPPRGPTARAASTRRARERRLRRRGQGELHAPGLRPPLRGVVRRDRAALAVPLGRQHLRPEALRRQEVLDVLGAPLRQHLVRGDAFTLQRRADRRGIGVAAHVDLVLLARRELPGQLGDDLLARGGHLPLARREEQVAVHRVLDRALQPADLRGLPADLLALRGELRLLRLRLLLEGRVLVHDLVVLGPGDAAGQERRDRDGRDQRAPAEFDRCRGHLVTPSWAEPSPLRPGDRGRQTRPAAGPPPANCGNLRRATPA